MSVYHGRVHPGGPPAVRELTDLIITKVSVGPRETNVYLLSCRRTGANLLIDAAGEAEALLALCSGRLDAVITTHRHHDHWQALAPLVAATGARTVAGAADVEGISVAISDPVADGDLVTFGDIALAVVQVAGHTPGSIAVRYDDPHGPPHLWTGDALLPGGLGRTDSPAAFHTLLHDLTTKVFERLPAETWIYPGHGDDTVLGRERPRLEEWSVRGW